MDEMNETQSGVEKTVAAPVADTEATLLGAAIVCPVCNTENSPGEKYCGECGFLLSSTPGEAVPAVEEGEQARLVDPAGQREYLLHPGENSVGRESTDVLLGDSTVSRRHALLVLDSGKCWIEDLGSANGTFVAGKQIQQGERMELADGTELKFGSAIFSVKLPAVEGEAIEAAEEEAPAEAPAAEVEAIEQAAPEVSPVARLVSTTDPGRDFAVVPGPNTIGRGAGNSIVLGDDPYVSSSHAELIADDSGLWLVDVGSTNGTVLNGTKIAPNERVAVNLGDEIAIGQSTFRLEAPVEASEPQAGDESAAAD
ncbi:MAG TPA: FHA domain-containing protein [Armatimonadota bacterium]|nr:FHA domain-containing protein [Armatimonadota bacterium]